MNSTFNITILIVMIVVCIAMKFNLAAQDVPGAINYQGRLLDNSGQPVTTPVSVTFSFWDAVSAGTQLGSAWNDSDTVTPDADGIYSTDIGDDPGNPVPASVFDTAMVWLNINIDGENLAPRVRLLTVPYAVKSNSASGLAGDLTNPGDRVALGTDVWLQVTADGILEIFANGQRHRLGTQQWTHPYGVDDHVSPTTTSSLAYDPCVAMNDKGDAVIAWRQWDGPDYQIYKSEYRNGTWIHPTGWADNISPDGEEAFKPQVAMNNKGDTVIVWRQDSPTFRRIFMSEFRNGSWTHPADLSEYINPLAWGTENPQVAMSENGDTIITWQQGDSISVWAIFKSEYRNDSWTHPVDLDDNISYDTLHARTPKVAMNNAGDTVIAWAQADGSRNQIFKSEYRSGSWTHPSGQTDNISPDGQHAYFPHVALNNNGDTVIVWYQSNGSNQQVFKSEYRSGSWTHPVDLADNISPDGQFTYDPQATISENGDTVIVWRQRDGSADQVFMSEYRNSSWSHPVDLSDNISPGSLSVANIQIAGNESGEAIIVWNQSDGSNSQIFKSEYRNGSWSHPADLADNISRDGYSITNPDVALNSKGNVVIVWQQAVGSYSHIFKSEYRLGF